VTKQAAHDYLATIQQRLRDEGVSVQTEALHTDPVGAIIFAARSHGADLIMMTTHGRTGFRKLMFGSVADQLLHETTVPLFFIRADQEQARETVAPFKRILVPLDGTKFSETALAFVAREGLADGNYLKLLYVVSPAPVPFTAGGQDYTPSVQIDVGRMEVEQRLFEARQYLSAVAEEYLPGTMPHFQVVVEHAAKAIVEIADVQSIDLIAMATHARSGFDRLAHGSVAGNVLHHTAVPVLLLHGVEPPVEAEVDVAPVGNAQEIRAPEVVLGPLPVH